MRLYFGPLSRRRYRDGGEGGKEGDPPPESKTFTQKDVDDIINKRFGKEKAEKEKMIAELNELRQSKTLTAEQKDSLGKRVEELEATILTKEEQAAKERTKLEREYKTRLDETSKDRDTWRSRFIDSSLERALTDAAVEAGAESPTQIRMMLRGLARLDEKDFTPLVKIQGLGSDGKTVEEFELPIRDAVIKLRDDGLNKNLFKPVGATGTGKQPGTGTRGRDPSQRPNPDDFKSHEEFQTAYQAWRDDYNADGTKKRKQ